MLQFQEVLSIYEIDFWCEMTIAVLIRGNIDLCFGQKDTMKSRLSGRGSEFSRRIDV